MHSSISVEAWNILTISIPAHFGFRDTLPLMFTQGTMIKTVEDIKQALPKWFWVRRYGEDILECIRTRDGAWLAQHEAAIQQRKDARKAESVAKAKARNEARREALRQQRALKAKEPKTKPQKAAQNASSQTAAFSLLL